MLDRVVLSVRPAGGRGWGGGYEGKTKFVYLKWVSHFRLSIENSIFHFRTIFMVLG